MSEAGDVGTSYLNCVHFFRNTLEIVEISNFLLTWLLLLNDKAAELPMTSKKIQQVLDS